MAELEKYEVIFKDEDGNRWSAFYQAENFGHAEEQARDSDSDQIVQIVRDYQ